MRSSIAIVIGPTPRGTGVMQRRALGGGVEVDVADEPVVGPVDADVDHRRARLAPSRPAPSAAVRPRRRARRRGGRRRAGRACASGRSSRSRCARAASAPRACRRGPSGRRRPPRRPPARRRGGRAAPCSPRACTAAGRAVPWPAGRPRPASSPSTSLAGSISHVSPLPSMCAGVGSWSRMPETRGSALSSASSASTSACGVSAASRWSKPVHPDLVGRLLLAADVDRRGGVLARPARSPAPAARGRPPPTRRPRRPPRGGPPRRSPCRR